MEWYIIENIREVDSPALVIYKNRIAKNIQLLIGMVDAISQLRPHVKTNKMKEVCQMMLEEGIEKFKCSTIAEAELLALIGAEDVLLAHQPVGPKLERLMILIAKYPQTTFSCIVDNSKTAYELSALSKRNGISINIFIDLNVGMNRTGILPQDAMKLSKEISVIPGLRIMGLHIYDGHIRIEDFNERRRAIDECFKPVYSISEYLTILLGRSITIVAGGSPSFPVHAKRADVECSPGTFIFWDWGYKHILTDEPFEYAALVITRIISIVNRYLVCLDLGHKAVSAENPLPRVHFLNVPGAIPIAQNEEHLVVKVDDSSKFNIGDVWYGVPVHICPTVALYDKAYVIEDNRAIDEWKVIARNRSIGV